MAKQSKYRNKPVVIDGIRFHSTKEGNYYLHLKMLQKAGVVESFERQIPYKYFLTYNLNGREKTYKEKYVADFVVTYTSEKTIGQKVAVIDVKGHRTKEYLRKKEVVESLFQIKIIEV